MRDGKLTKWLFENRCFISKDDKRSFTHLCLDGGKLCISQSLHDEFIKMYIQGLKEEKYYICEVPTSICRMYCDLDFIDKDIYDLDKIKEIVKVIHDTVKYYYDKSFNITVCMTTSKNVTREKKQMVKTGVHLIWENLYVSKKNALNLSKQFVKDLKEKFGERPEYNKWDDVIDDCVYSEKSASLRMVGSSKISKKRRTDKETGKTEMVLVDEKRIYKPVWVYSEDKENTFSDNLEKCIIRVYEAETEWVDDIPEYIPPEKSKKGVYNGVSVANADPIFYKVEKFIRKQTLPEWDRPLRMLKNQGKFYIAKIDSGMYCLNIKRDHNSCGIYFQIFEEGLVQRCFCRCKTKEGRQFGFCSNFKSRYFMLPYELKALMFPCKKKKRIVKKDILSSYSGTTSLFGSYSSLKKNRNSYLKMSMNTIKHLEQQIKELENGKYG